MKGDLISKASNDRRRPSQGGTPPFVLTKELLIAPGRGFCKFHPSLQCGEKLPCFLPALEFCDSSWVEKNVDFFKLMERRQRRNS